jgi:hypothetical protein
MRSLLLRSLFLTAALASAAISATGAGAAGAGRHPLAQRAEAAFFATFNGFQGEEPAKSAALPVLLGALATDPADARTPLLLGLNHLWIAAEGDRSDPRVLEHLFLAERYLARAQELNPKDRRIPSWLVPVRLSLTRVEGKEGREKEILRDLQAAYAEDPTFHSFSVGLLGIAEPRTSPEFQQGLAALRATLGTCPEAGSATADPTCANTPRWPHNREGYMTFIADYELKAGNVDKARELLMQVRQDPDYPRWPFKAQAEDRWNNLERYAALYGNQDPKDDPPHLMSGAGRASCQACHRG